MIRILLFEDNKNLRESLSLYLAGTDGLWLSGAYANATDAVKLVRKYQPDVVLMDIQMPGISGIEAMRAIKKVNSEVKVLIQTVFENDDKVFAAICAGANGYIIKTPKPENYVQAITDVYNGGSHLSPSIAAKVLAMFQSQFVMKEQTYVSLTPREKEVLQCMVKGMSYKMIADACNISFSTVHSHIKNIYEKLHVNSAPEAVVKALEMRLV
ncbi:response regulator transcription factor [Emticicia sp. BO119]|uniref:response regulator transcription factor n=1 Tax=Emticicia sp. BO119 TaxID=2757768 RepID=UPI0015F108F3|nr:response regulator transcription factor [Emticicia sp. BO119]MBA4848777.1 response regulator transcription factor [Emticicia sp. BO119]